MLSSSVVQASRAVRPLVSAGLPVIIIIDDDIAIRETLRGLLDNHCQTVETYSNAEQFLSSYRPGRLGCPLIDVKLPGLNGIELLQQLRNARDITPAITENPIATSASRKRSAGRSVFKLARVSSFSRH